ncbi:MAG: response regulator [Anaerolineales bacterium]|nr:MAG: response regulator [Anaerolineales bacterium]
MNVQDEIRVLIVDDNPMVGDTIQTMLEGMGYIVAGTATDGARAVEMTQSVRPDVILMDVDMPNMDGIQATQLIQASCPTPVVVLTAYEPPELVERASAAGVGAYLVKPPRAPEIERAMTIAMARFADMMELRRLNSELQARNQELEEAMAQVKILRGLLPICMGCKRIRNDGGYWEKLETYIRDHSEAQFSHGLCPDCARELYPGMFKASK